MPRFIGITGTHYHNFEQWLANTNKHHCFYDTRDDYETAIIWAYSERREDLGYWNSAANIGVIFDAPAHGEWAEDDYDHLVGEL